MLERRQGPEAGRGTFVRRSTGTAAAIETSNETEIKGHHTRESVVAVLTKTQAHSSNASGCP